MMPRNSIVLRILAISGLVGPVAHAVDPTPLIPGNWQLQLQDDFNGNSLDGTKWRLGQHWSGIAGSANVAPENVTVAGGNLRMKMEQRSASYGGATRSYATGEVSSFFNFSQKHGMFEARIKYPAVKGLWPAFWLMPDRGDYGWKDSYNRTYVKFDLTGVNPGTINTAELKMKVSSFETGGNNSVAFMRLNDDSWSESGITWNNAPVPDPVWITQKWNQAVTGSDMTVNVRNFVTTEMNGNKTISFVLADTFMQTKAVKFHSREAATQADRPRLVINGTTYYATEDANIRWGTYANTNYPATTELTVKDEWGNTADTWNGGMEIDVMESLGIWGPDTTAHAMHWNGYGSGHQSTGSGEVTYPANSDGYHVYGLYWQEGLLEFYVDGVKTYEWENSRVMSVPAYLILSLQGGGWDGNNVGSQVHNQTMEVDWVRTWSGIRSDVPVVNVSGNGLPIPIGSSTPGTANHTQFGLAWVGEEAVTRTYTIFNTGDAPLILDPPTISGTDAADFSVSAQPVGPVAAGGSTTFSVQFSPSISGLRSAVVSIGNNDADKTPYTFAIDGNGQLGALTGAETHGTWTNPSSGSWSTASNWAGTPGVIADGTNSIAYFNSLDVTAPIAVTLDSTRRIGGLVFSDTVFTNSTTNTTTRDTKWTLGNGGNLDKILTLAVSSGRPAVTVANMGTYVLNFATTPRSVEIGTALTGTQGFTKNGPGVLVLTGEGGFEGGLYVEDGTMTLSNTQAFSGGIHVAGATSRLEFNSDANLGNVTSIINSVTLTGGATLHRSGDSGSTVGNGTPLNFGTGGGTITYGGYTAASLGFSLAGNGAFNLSAGNKGVTLIGDNSAHTGGFNINTGNLYLANPQSVPTTGSILVNANGALGGGGAYYTIQEWLDSDRIDTNSTGQIQLLNRGGQGSGTSNSETIDMTGYNSLFLGASDVVNLGAGNILNFSGTLTPAGNSYRLTGGRGATLALVSANILTGTNNLIIGNGTFSATVNLNASNNHTGTTTVAGNNTVLVAASNALGAGAVSMLGSSVLRLSGGVSLGNALTLFGVPADANTGALHSNSGANLWTGDITLGGNSRIVAANTASNSLVLGGIGLNTRALTFIAGGSTGGDIAVTGAITGSGGITKTNTAGMLTLNAANSNWSGSLSLQGGTLAIGNDAALGTGGTLTLSNSATIRSTDATARTIGNALGTFAGTTPTYTFGAVSGGTGNLTFSNPANASLGTAARIFTIHNTTRFNGGFTGSGASITKSGDGTMILNGTSTYSGSTTVSAGTLGGTGTLGATTIEAGGALAPGDTGTGTLKTGAVTFTGGSFAVEINGTTCDKLLSTGAVDLSGATLTVALLGSFTGPYVIAEGASVTGAMTVPSGFAVNISNGTQAVLTQTGAPANYTGWASANNITGGANGDSDHDGIPNAIEYALNLNPAGSDGIPGDFSGNVVTFHKRAGTSGNSDLSYRIELSSDLGISTPWAEVGAYLQNNASIISATVPNSPGNTFARLRIVIAP